MRSGAFVGRRERNRSGAGTQRAAALGLVALAVAVGLVALYMLVPRAVVVLHPRTLELSTTVDVRIDPSATDASDRRVTARRGVTVVEVNGEVPVEGRRPAPEARAVGTVTLVNRAGGEVAVPAGTVVMTPSGARFATGAEATLGAAAGATTRVAVAALEPGEVGNVARLEISRVLGPLATRLAVLNEEPISGGGQSGAPMVAEADRARARALGIERARFDGRRTLVAELSEDERLADGTLAAGVLDEQYEGEVGEAATSVRYRARVRITGTVFSRAEVERAARAAWRLTPPSGYFLPSGGPEVGAFELAPAEGEAVTARVPLRAVAVAELDANAIRERVRWRNADAARRELARTLPLETEPGVRVEPGWIGRAPWRVDVVVDLNPPVAPRG